MKQLVAIHRICVCRCCTDRSLLCWIIVWRGCGGTCQNLGIFGIFGQNLAVFGPLGQFWTNLAKLALFGNFWDIPNFGILHAFWQNALWQNLDTFMAASSNFMLHRPRDFAKFRHFRHFWPIWPFLAHLGQFWQISGKISTFWQFSEIFPILVKF